ncbi:MAG: N-acetyltransferase [Actinomycetota bacterium]|nr:N-acetyltransferase [Actinomycetota bacterium]
MIRRERHEDEAEIFRVIEAAFADRSVATFAEQIRASAGYVPELAFVVEEEAKIVAHTMLSRVWLEGPDVEVLILTPMSVRPDRQRQGVGAALVETALATADERGEPLVLCEGVPEYYPRFGFVSAAGLGLEPPHPEIPDEAWMVCPLRAYDPALRGRVVYPSFFPPPPGA